jgi:hypothetical protein
MADIVVSGNSSGSVTLRAPDVSGTTVLTLPTTSGTIVTTAGATSLTTSGNLTFTGTGNRITGDFSNATVANRVAFETSTTNGNTNIPVFPNGTAIQTAIILNNANSSTADRAVFSILCNGATDATIRSGIAGTGTYLPLTMYTGGSERLRIDTSGNVGIGTNSPTRTLTVFTTAATDNNLLLRSGAANAYITFADIGTTDQTGLSVRIGSSGNNLVFNTGGTTERMRIDSSGNLLVGTTTANGRVSSVSKSGFNPAITAGTWTTGPAISVAGSFGGGVSWIDGSGGYCAWVDTSGTAFNIAGGSTSNAVANGVFLNGHAATSWSARSDERLKDKLEPITDAINKVNSLRAFTGVYKNFPDDRQAFLLAQDVQKVLPEAVSVADKRSPEQYLGLAYTQVIPLLVASIQELNAKVTALEAQLGAK